MHAVFLIVSSMLALSTLGRPIISALYCPGMFFVAVRFAYFNSDHISLEDHYLCYALFRIYGNGCF